MASPVLSELWPSRSAQLQLSDNQIVFNFYPNRGQSRAVHRGWRIFNRERLSGPVGVVLVLDATVRRSSTQNAVRRPHIWRCSQHACAYVAGVGVVLAVVCAVRSCPVFG